MIKKNWMMMKQLKKNVIMVKQLKKRNNIKTITYKLKFIDSFRFIQNSLSGLVDSLSEIN